MAFSTSSGGRGGGSYRTQTALSDINITPLVDVVLVLLLIFMLTAPVLQSGIFVALPKTRSTEALTEQRNVVTIDKDSNVYLQTTGSDKQVSVADLPKLLASGNSGESKQVVYVRADERVPFGAFANVMESIKHAGITNISVVTQPFDNH
jgi:biopolymer transport protein ExbD/biopolymer transport protein TolR